MFTIKRPGWYFLFEADWCHDQESGQTCWFRPLMASKDLYRCRSGFITSVLIRQGLQQVVWGGGYPHNKYTGSLHSPHPLNDTTADGLMAPPGGLHQDGLCDVDYVALQRGNLECLRASEVVEVVVCQMNEETEV